MKRFAVIGVVALAAAGVASGGEINSQADAFKAGQDFSKGAKGQSAASGSVKGTTAKDQVPKYSEDPKEASAFGGGKTPIGGNGTAKINECKTKTAGNAYDQQECDAVNYLNNMNRTNTFTIDKKTDPLLVGSKDVINNPGVIPATGTSMCHIEKVTVPGTYETETCEQSTVLTTVACKNTLMPECGYVGTPITTKNTSRSGAFVYSDLWASGGPGMYAYNLEVPYRNCGGDGAAEVNFNLDTIGFGSYITINMANLDDAAAVAVNGTTVFAGYPNAGPVYSGGMFPTERTDFQIGYGWTEDVGGDVCVAYDYDGYCTKYQHQVSYQGFWANTKLLDYCPGGYGPTPQKAYQYCDWESGYCSPLDGYSGRQVMGFFCNAEGKFLMNRHEGGGTWGGSVSSVMPLKQGMNTIKVYWGTGYWGKACGNVKVYGNIYNVAPGCTQKWDDQCAQARASLVK